MVMFKSVEYTGDWLDLSRAFGLPCHEGEELDAVMLGMFIVAHADDVRLTLLTWARKFHKEEPSEFSQRLVHTLTHDGVRGVEFMANNIHNCWA